MLSVTPAVGGNNQTLPGQAGIAAVALEVLPHPDMYGVYRAISRWKPTDAERRRIAEGADVFVVLYTDKHLQLHEVQVGGEDLREDIVPTKQVRDVPMNAVLVADAESL